MLLVDFFKKISEVEWKTFIVFFCGNASISTDALFLKKLISNINAAVSKLLSFVSDDNCDPIRK